jgi:RimK-like ATP-grasp domain
MILFFGRCDDPPLTEAVEAARAVGAEHLLLDQATLHHLDLVVEIGSSGIGGRIRCPDQDVRLEDVGGVYARPLELPTRWQDSLHRHRAEAFNQAFLEWMSLAPTTVVNRPTAMDSNSSKPYQAQLIGQVGFCVPATLISSDPEEIRVFWETHGRVVYKSVSGVRSIVRELDAAAAKRLDLVRALPTQFQAYVPGNDVRVHVVGDLVFAAEVTSLALDYRYAGRQGLDAVLRAVELPDEVSLRCIAIAKRLDLSFCGIDLRRQPDGQYVCFEVNPMPAYSYYQASTGLPISQALVRLLAADMGPHGGDVRGRSSGKPHPNRRPHHGAPAPPAAQRLGSHHLGSRRDPTGGG